MSIRPVGVAFCLAEYGQMMSSTKPEIDNVMHCSQERTFPRPQLTCTENFVKFGRAVFTARRHARAVYAVVVCLSICLSQVDVVLKWLNAGSRKQRHTIAQGILFSDATKRKRGHPQRRRQMQVGYVNIENLYFTRINNPVAKQAEQELIRR